MDIELLRKEVSALHWFHRIDLGNGIITPGQDIDGETKIEFNKIPTDLRGKTVLDIGAWDGLFSFEAERRGAARVLATDSFCWNGRGGARRPVLNSPEGVAVSRRGYGH